MEKREKTIFDVNANAHTLNSQTLPENSSLRIHTHTHTHTHTHSHMHRGSSNYDLSDILTEDILKKTIAKKPMYFKEMLYL